MVKPVRNNMKQNIHSLLYKSLKKVTMTIKHQVIVFIVTTKYFMNNKHMKNRNSQKIIWQV